jgi:hypothetical protein
MRHNPFYYLISFSLEGGLFDVDKHLYCWCTGVIDLQIQVKVLGSKAPSRTCQPMNPLLMLYKGLQSTMASKKKC